MVDVVSPESRSRMMSGIRGKNTQPELLVRKALTGTGYRYRLHRRDLPGAPDIVMPGRKLAIFVHGCFWHKHGGCRLAQMPSTRREFWAEKLGANVARDKKAICSLREQGWRVLVVWECSTKSLEHLESLPCALANWIESDNSLLEISA